MQLLQATISLSHENAFQQLMILKWISAVTEEGIPMRGNRCVSKFAYESSESSLHRCGFPFELRKSSSESKPLPLALYMGSQSSRSEALWVNSSQMRESLHAIFTNSPQAWEILSKNPKWTEARTAKVPAT